MISTVLANMGRWSTVAIVAVAAVLLVAGWLLSRRDRAGRRIAGVVALLALVAALALALVPESGATARDAFCFVGDGIPSFDDRANIALLFPVAFFGTIAIRRPLPVLAATAGLSALVETVQGAAAALNRSCDLHDWYANTSGAVIGALLGAIVLVAARRPLTRAPAAKSWDVEERAR